MPRLERDSPGQPDSGSWKPIHFAADSPLVFDREGYSPSFFAEIKTRRIAILSYRKFPGEPGRKTSSARTKSRLIEHGCEPIPDSTRVVNPHWRALDAQVRHHNAKLNRELASFAAASLPADPKPEDVGK